MINLWQIVYSHILNANKAPQFFDTPPLPFLAQYENLLYTGSSKPLLVLNPDA
jgi:hypothetical protein